MEAKSLLSKPLLAMCFLKVQVWSWWYFSMVSGIWYPVPNHFTSLKRAVIAATGVLFARLSPLTQLFAINPSFHA